MDKIEFEEFDNKICEIREKVLPNIVREFYYFAYNELHKTLDSFEPCYEFNRTSKQNISWYANQNYKLSTNKAPKLNLHFNISVSSGLYHNNPKFVIQTEFKIPYGNIKENRIKFVDFELNECEPGKPLSDRLVKVFDFYKSQLVADLQYVCKDYWKNHLTEFIEYVRDYTEYDNEQLMMCLQRKLQLFYNTLKDVQFGLFYCTDDNNKIYSYIKNMNNNKCLAINLPTEFRGQHQIYEFYEGVTPRITELPLTVKTSLDKLLEIIDCLIT